MQIARLLNINTHTYVVHMVMQKVHILMTTAPAQQACSIYRFHYTIHTMCKYSGTSPNMLIKSLPQKHIQCMYELQSIILCVTPV